MEMVIGQKMKVPSRNLSKFWSMSDILLIFALVLGTYLSSI